MAIKMPLFVGFAWISMYIISGSQMQQEHGDLTFFMSHCLNVDTDKDMFHYQYWCELCYILVAINSLDVVQWLHG